MAKRKVFQVVINAAQELRKLGGTQAERMARAAEQGYDTSRVFYHGTGADVTEFDPLKMGKTDDGWFSKGFYFSPDAKVANQYAADGTPNVMPVYLRAENPYDWRKEVGQGMRFGTMDERYAKTREIMGSGHDSVDVYDEIVQLGDGEKLSDDVWQAIVARSLEIGNPVLPRDLVENGLRQGMTSKGEFARYYGDELANKMPLTRTLRERVVFDPSQVRSVNADFNPEYKDSSNLLAGIAGVMPYAGATAAALAGVTGSQEAEAGPLQTLGRAAPYLATGALGAAMMTPQDAQAEPISIMPPTYSDTMQRTQTAIDKIDQFKAKRAGKRGAMDIMKLELQTLLKGANEVANDVIFPALDKPLQGYLGLSEVFGSLAQGKGFDTAMQRGAQVATQPSENTLHNMGQATERFVRPISTPQQAEFIGDAAELGLNAATMVFSP